MESPCGDLNANWQPVPTKTFSDALKWYDEKRPAELAGVMNNFKRYWSQLIRAKNSHCVQAGYMHTEGKGVIAIDQRGGGGNLEETRLYVFAEDSTKTLHLITIGNKKAQKRDVKLCHEFVASLTP